MEIKVKIEAPGLMEAIMALAEQLQELNAHQAGQPVPTEPLAPTESYDNLTKNEEKTEEKVEKEPKNEDIALETVRALVVKSKASKEKAKEIMTGMGIKKMTDLDQEQLNTLYAGLQEV